MTQIARNYNAVLELTRSQPGASLVATSDGNLRTKNLADSLRTFGKYLMGQGQAHLQNRDAAAAKVIAAFYEANGALAPGQARRSDERGAPSELAKFARYFQALDKQKSLTDRVPSSVDLFTRQGVRTDASVARQQAPDGELPSEAPPTYEADAAVGQRFTSGVAHGAAASSPSGLPSFTEALASPQAPAYQRHRFEDADRAGELLDIEDRPPTYNQVTGQDNAREIYRREGRVNADGKQTLAPEGEDGLHITLNEPVLFGDKPELARPSRHDGGRSARQYQVQDVHLNAEPYLARFRNEDEALTSDFADFTEGVKEKLENVLRERQDTAEVQKGKMVAVLQEIYHGITYSEAGLDALMQEGRENGATDAQMAEVKTMFLESRRDLYRESRTYVRDTLARLGASEEGPVQQPVPRTEATPKPAKPVAAVQAATPEPVAVRLPSPESRLKQAAFDALPASPKKDLHAQVLNQLWLGLTSSRTPMTPAQRELASQLDDAITLEARFLKDDGTLDIDALESAMEAADLFNEAISAYTPIFNEVRSFAADFKALPSY